VSEGPRFVGVGGEGLVGFEVPIALYWKPKLTADGGEFGERNVSELLGSRLRSAVRASLRSGRVIHVSAFAGMLLTPGPRPAGPA
jgi:hypothetical protein